MSAIPDPRRAKRRWGDCTSRTSLLDLAQARGPGAAATDEAQNFHTFVGHPMLGLHAQDVKLRMRAALDLCMKWASA